MDSQHTPPHTDDEGKARRAQLEHTLSDMADALLTAHTGMWLWESASDILHVTKRYTQASGYGPNMPIYWRQFMDARVHPEDREAFREHMRAMIASPDGGDQLHFFYRQRHASGSYEWVLSKGFVVTRDTTGAATRIIGMSFDVQTLAHMNEKHIVEHDRMSFALEAARDGLWDWNTETNVMYFSPRYISMLGYAPDDFEEHLNAWLSRVHADDVDVVIRKKFMHINATTYGDTFECVYRFLAADGAYHWMMSRGKIVYRDAHGRGVRVVGLHTDVTELRMAQESLTRIVNYDQLTKLSSRFAYDTTFNGLGEAELPVSIIYIDVDALKLVNDTLGHAAGDNLLSTVADIVRRVFRASDVVARLGGDEFAALLPNCPSSVAERLMEKIHTLCAEHNQVDTNMPIGVSMGMAGTDMGISLRELLTAADKAMMQDKEANAPVRYTQISTWLERYSERRVVHDRRHTLKS